MDTQADSSEKLHDTATYRVYKERWLIVFVYSLLQFTNAALWINFASVANYSAEYFQVETYAINWFSMLYFVAFAPLVFAAMWVVKKYGFKVGLYIVCILNAAGGLVRDFATYPFVDDSSRYAIAMTGQTLAAITMPFLMTLTTKISQDWFDESGRTISTTICAQTSPLGSAIGSLVPPLIVRDKDDLPLMSHIFSGLAILADLMGIFCRNEKPPTPPSNTSQQLDELSLRKPLVAELQIVLKNIPFLVFVFGSGAMTIGIPSSFGSILQQMLCPWGYSNTSVGLCSGILIGSGIPGSILFTYLVDKTKKYAEITKIAFAIFVPAYVAFILCWKLDVSTGKYVLPILCVFIGIFGGGLLPISLELAVEDAYPVDESITAGLIVLSGQVQAAVYVPLMTSLNRPLTPAEQQTESCSINGIGDAYDMTYSGIFMIGMCAICSISTTAFYWPKYKRMEAEKLKINQA